MRRNQQTMPIAIVLIGAVTLLAGVARQTRVPQKTVAPAVMSIQKSSPEIGSEIDRLMNRFVQGDFPDEPISYTGGGWTMKLPDGKQMDRDGLRTVFAVRLIDCGVNAVPHLFKWVMHDNLAIRYIAAYSLEQITGIRCNFIWFDQKDADQQREIAVARWQQWWNRCADGTQGG
jgi:hypothetical protein